MAYLVAPVVEQFVVVVVAAVNLVVDAAFVEIEGVQIVVPLVANQHYVVVAAPMFVAFVVVVVVAAAVVVVVAAVGVAAVIIIIVITISISSNIISIGIS